MGPLKKYTILFANEKGSVNTVIKPVQNIKFMLGNGPRKIGTRKTFFGPKTLTKKGGKVAENGR